MEEQINQETGEITPIPPTIRNGNPWTRVRVAKHFTGPSLAKQSFKEECDINNIMRKFKESGVIEHLNTHHGDYGNFIGFDDYQTSLNKIHEAQDAFMTLPVTVRKQFDNSPQLFLAFAQNPDNLEKMQEMGLAPKTPARDRYAPKDEKPGKPPGEPVKPIPGAVPPVEDPPTAKPSVD